MAIEKNDIKDLITCLGFIPDESGNIFSKFYENNDYSISIDFENEKIDYGRKIKCGDETTSNFEKDENFVVLECVDRLLEKGYRPEDLELEKRYKLGHTKKSGKADISVTGKDNKTLFVIECKTYVFGFANERQIMLNDGGQLFSYFQQDKNAKFLCLYSSQLINNKIDKENLIVNVHDTQEEQDKQEKETERIITFERAKNIEEMLQVWQFKNKKHFLSKGIFEDEFEAYNPGFEPLKKKDLKDFGKDEKNKLYGEFEEILRHNNISDRSNAFNRIISLILAKIVDEEKSSDQILDFQIKSGFDTPEDLFERLLKLYTKAMKYYLKEDVVNYSRDDIEEAIKYFPRQAAKERIKKILLETKFYSNNEYAFKEIYNRELFNQNSKVLEEVVSLFQPFKFKYARKAQFLGDFFELLLESGYKQTEGQFFTPTPIARFMLSSLPIKEIILNKLNNNEPEFLPKLIDYACGSGHFLTEAIEEIQQIVEELEPVYDDVTNEKLKQYQQSTEWAKEFIFGIEKDYRLARTSQVACFMHGDGDANIIFGDGLELHERFKEESFDFLVSNPPYSIKDFKQHLNKDNIAPFELLNGISNDSDDIEAIFLERIKLLLKIGGFAGVFFPSSILSNTGLYTKAREILLRDFEIKAIVEPGSNSFAKTGTNTVILFLKRRSPDFAKDCRYIAEDFIKLNKERNEDFTDSKQLLKNYIEFLNLNFDDYKTLLEKNSNENLKQSEFYQNYEKSFNGLTEIKNLQKSKPFQKLSQEEKDNKLKNLFYDYVLDIETEKFEFFLLAHRLIKEEDTFSFINQKLFVVKAGSDNDTQREFLGYKFSERRGYKGIDLTMENELHKTKLYSIKLEERNNEIKNETIEKVVKDNPEKVNYYISNAMQDNFDLPIHNNLSEHISLVNLIDCLDFESINFEKQISLSEKNKISFEDIWQNKSIISLDEIAKIEKGTSITSNIIQDGTVPVIAGGKEPAYYHNKANREPDVITISASGANAGYINYFKIPIFASDCTTIKSKDEKSISTFLIYQFLKSIQDVVYKYQRGQAQPHVYSEDLKRIKIPRLPLDIQKQIISEITILEEKERVVNEKIYESKVNIKNISNNLFRNYQLVKLGSLCVDAKYGANVKAVDGNPKSDYRYIRITDIDDNGNLLNEWKTAEVVEAKYILEDGDVLFARSGATVGKTFLYKKEFGKALFAGYLIKYKTKPDSLLSDVLYLLTKSDNYKNWIKSMQLGASQPNINAQQYSSFLVPKIPIEEQNQIVSNILEIEKEIEELQNSISNISNEKKAILKRYLE